jgi:hypothetical protein
VFWCAWAVVPMPLPRRFGREQGCSYARACLKAIGLPGQGWRGSALDAAESAPVNTDQKRNLFEPRVRGELFRFPCWRVRFRGPRRGGVPAEPRQPCPGNPIANPATQARATQLMSWKHCTAAFTASAKENCLQFSSQPMHACSTIAHHAAPTHWCRSQIVLQIKSLRTKHTRNNLTCQTLAQ